jgi:hypothetical protein
MLPAMSMNTQMPAQSRDGQQQVDQNVTGEGRGAAAGHDAVNDPAGDQGEAGVAHGDDDGGDGERDEVALQVQGAEENLPPQAGVEAGLEIVFLLELGGHGESAKV